MKELTQPINESRIKPGLRIKLLTDLVAQAAILFLVLLFALLEDYDSAGFTFYLGIGSYQLCSSLAHLYYAKANALFKVYYVQLVVYFPFFLALFGLNSIGSGYLLLFMTPVTALYYFIITIISFSHARK